MIPRVVSTIVKVRERELLAVADVLARSSLGCAFGAIGLCDLFGRQVRVEDLGDGDGAVIEAALASALARQIAAWQTLTPTARALAEATGLPACWCRELAAEVADA